MNIPNLSAWAETVPALEHIWLGGFYSTRVAYSPFGERFVRHWSNSDSASGRITA